MVSLNLVGDGLRDALDPKQRRVGRSVSIMVEERIHEKEPILQVKNVSISFQTSAGMLNAIRGVSFTLHKGETVAIVGESGSGKSVTVKSIVGIQSSNQKINSGEILYTFEENGKRQQLIY